MTNDDPADQIRTTTYGVIRGALTQMSAATMKATHPANTVYVFSQPFTLFFNHGIVQFRRGQPYCLDPALKAALTTAGAPMSLA